VFGLLTARFRNSDFPQEHLRSRGQLQFSDFLKDTPELWLRREAHGSICFQEGHGKNKLLAARRRVCEATENLGVFGRAARFLDSRQTAQLRRGADYSEFQAVLDGLAVLVACYGRGAGRRGRMETHRAASLAASTGRQARGGENFVIDSNRKKVL
jgi:hypothetical protein